MRSFPLTSRFLPIALLTTGVFYAAAVVPSAQQQPPATAGKKAMTVEDYTKWRSITGQEMSGDGKWVVYGLSQMNTPQAESKPVLHLLNLGTNQDVAVTDGSAGDFSSDSKWLAYQVDPAGGGRGGRGNRGGGAPAATAPGDAQTAPGRGAAGAPPAQPRRVELRNLATGEIKSWQDIASFSFNSTSTHLLLRRRPANTGGGGRGGDTSGGEAPAGGANGAANASAPRGVDVTLHNLMTGRDQLLGSVGEASFNKDGGLLAYTVDAASKDSNGLFIVDLKNGRTIALDNDAKSYSRLTWNDAGTALAVLKGSDVEKMREKQNVLLAFPTVAAATADGPMPAPVVLDPTKADNFMKDWVVSDRGTVSWSDDGTRVYFGSKAQVAAASTARRNPDETADVDIWRTADDRIQSVQMVRADQDRNFTFREGFDTANGKFVKLADESLRDIEIAATGKWAVGRDARAYVSDYLPAAADFYRVDTTTGARTLMLKNQRTGAGAFGISPNGKTFLYWKDNKFQAYDLDNAASKTLGGTSAPSFIDINEDHPGPKPSFGIAGYTADGKNVIVNANYDLWLLPLDGSAAKNLTNGVGAKNEMRFRYVRTEPQENGGGPGGFGGGGGAAARQTIDLSKPITLSAYGEWTKKAGFYTLADGALHEVVYEDAAFSTPLKAAKADEYLFTRQTFTEYPDLRVSGADFKASKKITDANPQQADFLWGHRELIDFKDHDGHRLQALLTYPDDYKPGEKRPMLVNFYEKNSQNLNRYSAPSLLTGMGSSPMQAVSDGYLTLVPDVYFHTGSSHSDMLECVEAAVKKVIAMGVVDPAKIGINGHSYGGEGAAFIGTRSRLFAAVGVGAGVTDLFTDFSQSWGWSYQVATGGSGANGNDYYMEGQGRWGFSPWDKPDVYHFESALTHVPEVTAPFLIMHGTADPTVSFSEGMNLYNAMRFNKKNAILLAYTNEPHGLRGMANRKDLTIRYFQFFDHYLKGAPAPKWMTEGVSYIDKTDKDGNKIIK